MSYNAGHGARQRTTLYFEGMTDEAFEQLVEEGIAAIPDRFLRKLQNVAVMIADDPTDEQREENGLAENETLFGLYEGVPLIEREGREAMFPDKITIFKNPILDEASTPEEVREIVKDTVWHEIAHHFGMEEHEVRRAEARRNGREVSS